MKQTILKIAVPLVAGAAGCVGPVTRDDFSPEKEVQMKQVATEFPMTPPLEMHAGELEASIATMMPATYTGTVSATSTSTVFADPVDQRHSKIIDQATSGLEGLAGVYLRARIAHTELSTAQGRALREATPTLALRLTDEAAARTSDVYGLLAQDPMFAQGIDGVMRSLRNQATSTSTLEAQEVLDRLTQFRVLAGGVEPSLNETIAARYMGGRFGTDMSNVLGLHEVTQLARGRNVRLQGQEVLRYVGIDEAELAEDFEGQQYAYKILAAGVDPRFKITKAYTDGKGLTGDDWIAGLHYVSKLQNDAAMKEGLGFGPGLDNKNDAQRAEESMGFGKSVIPVFGPILAARGPWTGREYFLVQDDKVPELMVAVYAGVEDPTFSGASALRDRRVAAGMSHLLYATGGGAAALLLGAGSDKGHPTGRGGITDTTPGVDPGIGTGGIGNGAGVQ